MIPLPKSPAGATAILVAMIAIPTLAIATWDPHPTVQAVAPSTHATPVPTPDSTTRDGKQRSEKTTPATLSSNLQR